MVPDTPDETRFKSVPDIVAPFTADPMKRIRNSTVMITDFFVISFTCPDHLT